jgi:homoserine O-acetyltransferase
MRLSSILNKAIITRQQRRLFSARATTELSPGIPHSIGRAHPNKDLHLVSGGVIPAAALHIEYSTWGDPSLPVIALFPSMSNSCLPIESPLELRARGANWWGKVMGIGPNFGLDISKFHVVVGAVLGAPFGTTSALSTNPMTGKPFGPDFPRITPADMANVQSILLESLGINKVHAVVGGSMGGMQVIQFACMFPEKYDRAVAIAATAQTSPSTVALRSMQRAAVRADPVFDNGRYSPPAFPETGLRIARMIGTVAYRSRQEFDARFSWVPDKDGQFEVEKYLEHQATKFTQLVNYDANCYLALSEAMDRMNIGAGFTNFEKGASRIPADKEVMLLSYNTDVLTPPQDLERLASCLGSSGVNVHFEVLNSMLGHDTFLAPAEAPPLVFRLKEFLCKDAGGVDRVRRLVNELHNH